MTTNAQVVLYVYHCASCSHDGQLQKQETAAEVTTACSMCGAEVIAEWDGGVVLTTNQTKQKNWLLDPLLQEGFLRLMHPYSKWPITWVIGDSWVVQESYGRWLIGPDEPATDDQVNALLVQSGGVYELQNY